MTEPCICHEVMRPDAMILVFCMLSFKPTFSLSSFTLIKMLFSPSLSAIRVVSSAYLRLLMFFPAILIPCNVGDLDSIPGLGRSLGGEHGNPLHYSCLENAHGQRSLVGYSPWGRKESDTTERLSTAQHIAYILKKRKVLKSMILISF